MGVGHNLSLFKTLFEVIQLRLKTSDSETLDILALRLTLDAMNDEFAPAILQIDEAIEVLDQHDEKHATDEQKKVGERAVHRSDFATEYRAERRRVAAAAAAAAEAAAAVPKAKGKGKGKKGKPPAVAPLPPAPHMPSTISQATAKEFVPFGASIWRGVTRMEWCGHMPPYSRIHDKWEELGEKGAMLSVLKRLWTQHCEFRGLEYDLTCPHIALFNEAG